MTMTSNMKSSKMTELDDVMKEHMAYLVCSEHKPFSYKDFNYFEVNRKSYSMQLWNIS